MATVHYSELFGLTVQGEGLHTGVPSLFLRMFGCNFRCKNFSRTGEDVLGFTVTHNPEVVAIIKDIDKYKTLTDLPLVVTGCDSYAAVYPEFKGFAHKATTDELAEMMVDMLPFKKWEAEHLVITGGESLLPGWQRAYIDLLEHPSMKDLTGLTFETNGTQSLTTEFKEYISTKWLGTQRRFEQLTFSVSPKLSASGEPASKAIRPDLIYEYQLLGDVYLKFVVATEEDVDEAIAVIDMYKADGFTGPVYLMPAGGTLDTYMQNRVNVANMALANGLRYSDRLHINLWGNQWGT